MTETPPRARRAVRAAAWVGGFVAVLAWVHRPIFLGHVLAAGDVSRLAIPDATFLLECLRVREWPLWTPYERLGQPFAAALHTQALYLPRFLAAWIFGPLWGVTLEQVFHSTLACVGTFFACRNLNRSRLASFISASAFVIAPMFGSLMFVPNMAGSVGWSGVLLATGSALMKRPSARNAAWVALAAAGSLTAGSPETWMWQAAVVVISLIRLRRFPRRSLLLVGALLFSFGLSAMLIFPAAELAPLTLRMTAWGARHEWPATARSMLALFWLNADLPRRAGEQGLLVSLFQGSVVCGLALVAGTRQGFARRFVVLAVGLALLALGDRLAPSGWLLSLPPFAWFRYPVKYLAGTAFCLCIAAAFGLDRIRAVTRRIRWRWLGRAAPTLAGVAVLELVIVSGLSGAWGWGPPEVLSRPSPLQALLPRPTEGRASITFEDEQLRARWPTAGERIAESRPWLVPLRNVEENVAIVEGYGPPELTRYVRALQASPRTVFDLAGVTHYFRFGPAPFPDLEREHVPAGGFDAYRTASGLPRAYLAQEVVSASDEEVLAALDKGGAALRRTVYVASDGAPRRQTSCDSSAPVWHEYTPTRLSLEIDACAASQLVITDTFFPGWRATVDGTEVPIQRAQLFVRAVAVPAGRHTVAMEYLPQSFRWGWWVSGAAWGVVGWGARRRKPLDRLVLHDREP